jgi:6-methylsalicylate decarboxylase
MAATDLHQHLWPESLLRMLAARSAPPRLRREDSNWVLDLAGEPPSPMDLAAHDPAAHAAQAAADGIDRIVIAPSTPIGIEALPARQSRPLLDAFHEGILGLGPPFALWGSIPLAAPSVEDVDAVLDAGAVGLCLPAPSLVSVGASDVLARLEERGAPLLVHPGPASAPAAAPGWWPALTDYVASMSAAWHAFAASGRAAHPRLRVVWAMLAGGAPLHAERLAARGGPAGALHDELSWFDVSSYGPRAVDAMLRAVGVDRLVYGTDRPVVDPPSLAGLGPAVHSSIARANPAHILDPLPLAA